MNDINDVFSPKAAAAIEWLLPQAGREASAPPVITVTDWLHVKEAIGTPAVLDGEVRSLGLVDSAALPPATASLLMNVVTLFACAAAFFDTNADALAWWQSPLRLRQGEPRQAPRDWAGEPGKAAELATRIRRTMQGIY